MKEKMISLLITLLLVSSLVSTKSIASMNQKAVIMQTNSEQDVLVIDDVRKLAFFGWYGAVEMPITGWNILNRTLLWSTSYMPQNTTNVLLLADPSNLDADEVERWLTEEANYNSSRIARMDSNAIESMSAEDYAIFNLVIYWGSFGYNSTSTVASGVPFVTVSPMQTDEMGIGIGNITMDDRRNTFFIESNNYYPTEGLPFGPVQFESNIWFATTEASANGTVLVKAEVETVSTEVEMSMSQDIGVYSNGSAKAAFKGEVPSSPLAEMYRETFFTDVPPYDPGVEYDVPENKTVEEEIELERDVKDASLIGDINFDYKINMTDIEFVALGFGNKIGDENYEYLADFTGPEPIVPDGIIDMRDVGYVAREFGTSGPEPEQTVIPVKDVFHGGIMTEQTTLLGFDILISDSKVIPWTVDNGTIVSLLGYAPQLANVINGSFWRINVGPVDENATQMAAEFIFTKIHFTQLMLRSLPGDQIYNFSWSMAIKLPSESELLNAGEFNGTRWTINFGGGTSMVADVVVELTPAITIIVHESMIVTENSINASSAYLEDTFSEYKIFNIDYKHPDLLSQPLQNKAICSLGEDWSKRWTKTLRKTYSTSYMFLQGVLLDMSVEAQLSTEIYVGWSFSGWRLQWFRTYFEIEPSIEAEAVAIFTAPITEGMWSRTFATWSQEYSFWIDWVPVEVNLRLTVKGCIAFRANGEIIVSAGATASAYVKAGVEWIRGTGWRGIWEHGSGADKYITAFGSAKATLTPKAICRLSLLFYEVAGPFIELMAYAPITVTVEPLSWSWSITVKFKIIAGATFAGWLKDLLDLNDYQRQLGDWTLASWSGP